LVQGLLRKPFIFQPGWFIIAKKLKRIRPSLLPGIVWFIISAILLTLPGKAFPKETWLDKIGFDKWVHVAIFSMLVFLLCWGLFSRSDKVLRLKKVFTLITVFILFYGIAMEYVQDYWIPNRSFDFGDIVADAGGCLAGWWLAIRFYNRYIKNKPL
jgi:hypothetical protein